MTNTKRIGFLDLKSGVSGDMLLSAFCHQAVPQDFLFGEIKKIPFAEVNKVKMVFKEKKKNGIAGLNFTVTNTETKNHRTLKDIKNLIFRDIF